MTNDNRFWPRFSPEINFGHLLQAAVLLLTIGTGAIDETTGECSLQVGGETKTLSFGPGGIRIVGRGR